MPEDGEPGCPEAVTIWPMPVAFAEAKAASSSSAVPVNVCTACASASTWMMPLFTTLAVAMEPMTFW